MSESYWDYRDPRRLPQVTQMKTLIEHVGTDTKLPRTPSHMKEKQ